LQKLKSFFFVDAIIYKKNIMLGYYIRMDLRVNNENYAIKPKLYSLFKRVRTVVSPIKTPDCMIDLEAGLNNPEFILYEPRDIHKPERIHRSKISI